MNYILNVLCVLCFLCGVSLADHKPNILLDVCVFRSEDFYKGRAVDSKSWCGCGLLPAHVATTLLIAARSASRC